MESDLDMLVKLLKQSGYSVTYARKQVFLTMVDAEPLTISQISSQAKDIDRASVYRTISLFESLRIINRINLGWKYKLELSDIFRHHHHHISCKVCGNVTDIQHSKKMESLIQKIAKTENYEPLSHQLEIIGICSSCQN